jgi:uncharacterized pyridoxamine 5'-phosphate oxidase family protein
LFKSNNIFEYQPNSKHFVFAGWSLSNDIPGVVNNKPRRVRKFVKSLKNTTALITLPNSNIPNGTYMNSQVISENGKIYLTTRHGEKVYRDLAYNPNSFWGCCQVIRLIDVILMAKYQFKTPKKEEYFNIEIETDFPACDTTDYSCSLWFGVGYLIKDTSVQHHINSQTHLMMPVAKILRRCTRFDSLTVYSWRAFQTKRQTIAVSSKVTSLQGNVRRTMAGHFINLIVASTFLFAIDIPRFLDTIIGNFKRYIGDTKQIALEEKYFAKRDIAEIDSYRRLWHTVDDFDEAILVAQKICKMLRTDDFLPLDLLEESLKRLEPYRKSTRSKDLSGIHLDRFNN